MQAFRWTNGEIGALCRALAHLYHAGIGMGDAFALLAEDEAREDLCLLLRQMSAAADEGCTPAEIFGGQAGIPPYVTGLLRVGGAVGRTEEALAALADHYEGRARLERSLQSALLYPAVLLAVLLAVVAALLMWVLPVFNEVYMQLGSRLTGMAGGLLALGSFLRRSLPLLCVTFGLLLAALLAIGCSEKLRQKLKAFYADRRRDRGMAARLYRAQFAQGLSMALRSGLTAEEAVRLSMELSEGSPAFQSRCRNVLKRLEEGAGLAAALREEEMLTPSACRLLEAGTRSGAAEVVMEEISLRMLAECEEELSRLAARAEPVLVIVLSLLVGAILLSVLLPLTHILSAIG